ncbi:hypothetical protein AAFF_G00053490 [Aldrovandia affinis]|uniref:Uncharacterized protein n=1 Tax=Aldrovandia affinis TaxID=143900 RepID=A0AAD7WEU8_9TELE|nr:hypothetical protein AAFF_G00053490 [Aldrovandia affinis]
MEPRGCGAVTLGRETECNQEGGGGGSVLSAGVRRASQQPSRGGVATERAVQSGACVRQAWQRPAGTPPGSNTAAHRGERWTPVPMKQRERRELITALLYDGRRSLSSESGLVAPWFWQQRRSAGPTPRRRFTRAAASSSPSCKHPQSASHRRPSGWPSKSRRSVSAGDRGGPWGIVGDLDADQWGSGASGSALCLLSRGGSEGSPNRRIGESSTGKQAGEEQPDDSEYNRDQAFTAGPKQ